METAHVCCGIEHNELEALLVGNFGAIRGVKAAVREYMLCLCDC